MKKKITVIYDYFHPAFKAGGPIQSLVNLTAALNSNFDFKVITGAFDKGEKTCLLGIKAGQWNNRSNGIEVYYWRVSVINFFSLLKQYRKTENSIHYINGIYSIWFNILPMFLYKNNIVLSPRGMLHDGALSQKSAKKKFYFFFFKLFNWHKKVIFHATDEKEKEYIQQQFGNNVKVFVAPNVPKNIGQLPFFNKQPGELSLVSIALVGPMKNYHLVLSALKNITGNVVYNIYGPVINSEYWNECLNIIETLPANVRVNYHGELNPEKVKEALEGNHIFILPSVSENFGHAIFESFSAGRPVITSNNTPWKNLEQNSAGWNADTTAESIASIINKAVAMNDELYQSFCAGAKVIADDYLNKADFSEAYKQLFGE